MLSCLSIGTAQLAQKYGIYNYQNMMTLNDFEKILIKSYEFGINSIDTAQSYESEKLLGQIGVKEFEITTKITIQNDMSQNKSIIPKLVDNSLENLKIDYISNLLLHNPLCLKNTNGEEIIESLMNEKNQGKIKKIGISIYGIPELEELLGIFNPDVVQFPYNIFDQRMEDTGLLNKLKSLSIDRQCRSIFLQGLLLQTSNKNNYFKRWSDLFNRWYTWIEENNIAALQASINFVLANKTLNKIVVGCKTYKEFIQIIDAFHNVSNIFPRDIKTNDEGLINPNNWSET